MLTENLVNIVEKLSGLLIKLYEEGICKLSVKPDIDLFASRLKPYVSYKPKRPALPKYKEVWDVNTVLEHLKTLHPAETLSLKLLSLKLVMLMAILSGQHCQTIHALTTRDMTVSKSKVMFIVNDLLKSTEPSRECTSLEFLSFDEDPQICVVRYLSEYLSRTKDTVSRWLKHELKLTGIDTSTFGAHSTRAASTSAAKAQKLSITTIMDSARWSSENTFMKYYNKTISKPQDNFGNQLLHALQQ